MLSDKAVQEFKDIYKKEHGQDLTDAEAREQSQRLANFVEIIYDLAIIEYRRELRLKKEKVKGFFLDPTEGPYTCAICKENYPGNEIWWNPKSLTCKDCWDNIQKKVIPSLDYDNDDKVWIKEWQLQYDYGLHPATRSKLRRHGLLKGRDLKRSDGSIYCTVYLISENEEFLRMYPKKTIMPIRFVNTGTKEKA